MSALRSASIDPRHEVDVSVDVRRDGVAFVTIDSTQGHGVLTPSFAAELSAAADRIEQDASIAAAVLSGGREGQAPGAVAGLDPEPIVLGADVDLLRSIKFATDAERLARDAGMLLRRLERLKKPLVAAVHDAVLGAGFELALACHALIATDDPRTSLGFPEISLGLIPSANGMLRVAQRAGIRAAIDLVLGGKPVTGRRGLDLGLVDELCARAIVLDVAARRAKALVGNLPRLRTGRRDVVAFAIEGNPVGRAFFLAKARERSRAKTSGHYPAPERALDVIEELGRKGFDAAAEREAKAFGELVVSETAHRLMELSVATADLKKASVANEGEEKGSSRAREVERVGIIGGGLMGGGIAYVSVISGVSVRLKERDDAAAGQALKAVGAMLDGARAGRGPYASLDRDHALARLSATTDYSGLRLADLVVEAVFEDAVLKRGIVHDLEGVVAPTCVLASTTSSIPIATIALGAKVPERVVGMHYFSPVSKIPLLEVVRADKTEAWAVATAVGLGRRQKKTVIVVKDGPGFYTTRILAPLVHEAAQLLAEGLPVETIDHAMSDWGFPVGPLRLLDEIGIDVASRVARLLHDAFGERMTPARAISKLVADERHGRKNRRGIYRYEQRAPDAPGGAEVDAGIYAVLGVEPTMNLPVEEIQMRCALSMINEALRSFGEGVIRCPRDGDVGAVLGLGFPPFRGGPFRYVDTIGAAEALRRVQGYADRFGERWRPAPLLVHMARKGERFYL
ncbi:MAG: 3-hydroxyacyl-CoA dehydrogenase NAD-binding domain-containing protein [Polyangiaceae bacterium]